MYSFKSCLKLAQFYLKQNNSLPLQSSFTKAVSGLKVENHIAKLGNPRKFHDFILSFEDDYQSYKSIIDFIILTSFV